MTRRRELLLAAAVGLAALAAYAPALGAGFFSDDYQWLGRMAPTLERPSYLFSVFYRDFNPVLHASFLADWLWGGRDALAYHLSSVLVHASCAALLVLLLRRETGSPWLGAAAALTWALNVRISEAVIWPAARGHSLATLFVLAALLALGRPGGWPPGTLLLVAGMLSKETAGFALILIPLFLREPRKSLRPLAAVGALGAGFVAFNLAGKSDFHTSAAGPAALALKVPFILLRPVGLGDWYDFRPLTMATILAGYAGLALALRRHRVALVGLLWVAACLVPIVPLDKLSSRYLYMLSVGYAFVLCGLLQAVARALHSPMLRRVVPALALGALALIWAASLLWIQREIGDYRLLAEPYTRCVETLRGPLTALAPGETVVVLDGGPRDAIATLTRKIAERGNMKKLVPNRSRGVDGLIELPDLVNLLGPRTPGVLAYAVDGAEPGPIRYILYTGGEARLVDVTPAGAAALPRERTFAARWGEAARYFETPR